MSYPTFAMEHTLIALLLVLALLLVEVDVLNHGARPFIGNVIGGVSLGVMVGFGGTRAALHLRTVAARNLFCLALMYGSYLLGVLLAVSGVLVVFATGLALAEYGDRAGVWPNRVRQPKPLAWDALCAVLAVALLFLGWLTHSPFAAHPAPILALAASTLIGGWLRWRLARQGLLYRPALGRALLLLAAALLLWPVAALLPPPSVALAIFGTLLGIASTLLMAQSIFDMFGVHRRRDAVAPREHIHVFDGRDQGETIQVWLN